MGFGEGWDSPQGPNFGNAALVGGSLTIVGPNGPYVADPDLPTTGGISTLWLNRDLYVAPPSGSAATDTANMTAALNAVIAATAGRVNLRRTNPGSPYLLSAPLPTINLPGVSLVGPGVGLCMVQPTSAITGDCVRVQMNPFTVEPAGAVQGFTLDLTNAGAGACGVHYGDVIQGKLGVYVKGANKAGSKGYWIDNRTNWTERTVWDKEECRVDDCTIGVLFDVNGGTTSMGYQDFAAVLRMNAGQTGVVLQNGAKMYNAKFGLKGNINGAGSVAWSILDTAGVGGINGGGATAFSVNVEGNGVGGPVGLSMAAGAVLAGAGVIDLKGGALTNTNAGTNNIQFAGFFNVPGIFAETGEGLVALGGFSLVEGPNDPTGPGARTNGTDVVFFSTGGMSWRPTGSQSGTGQMILSTAGLLTPASLSSAGLATFQQQTVESVNLQNGVSGAISINPQVVKVCRIILNGNMTGLTITANPAAGSTFELWIEEDGTGGWTVAGLPAALKWTGGAAPVWVTAAQRVNIVKFRWDGSVYRELWRSLGIV